MTTENDILLDNEIYQLQITYDLNKIDEYENFDDYIKNIANIS